MLGGLDLVSRSFCVLVLLSLAGKTEKQRSFHAAQSLHNTSACSRTVRVAFSCLSGR
jgi:hypothetical protein